MIAERLARRSEWVVACIRVILAFALLLISIADPEHFGFVAEPDDQIYAFYLIFAVLIASSNATDWLLAFRLRHLGLVVDLGAYLATMHVVEPMTAGSFHLSNVLFSFTLCAVFSIYGLRMMIYTLLALNLYSIWMFVEMIQRMPDLSPLELIRRQIYQIVISAAVALLAIALSDRKIEAFRVGFISDQDELASKALAYAVDHSGASAGFVHMTLRASEVHLLAAIAKGLEASPPERVPGDPVSPLTGRPLIFDKEKSKSAILTGEDQILIAALDPVAARFAETAGFAQGVILPLQGRDWHAVLAYALPRFAGAEHLLLADKIARAITTEVDYYLSHRSAELSAIARSKADLARDLHDSVAQSLSGARFWLLSLRSKITDNPEAVSELEDLAGMLRDEHEHVNDLIENLHIDYPGFQNISLESAMDKLLAKLIRNWRISIEIEVDPALGRFSHSRIHNYEQLVREAVANAVRHGHASTVKVHFWRSDAGIEIRFEDNGQGFDIGTQLPGSIAGRVNEHGGTLDVVSEPGATRLTVMFPA